MWTSVQSSCPAAAYVVQPTHKRSARSSYPNPTLANDPVIVRFLIYKRAMCKRDRRARDPK